MMGGFGIVILVGEEQVAVAVVRDFSTVRIKLQLVALSLGALAGEPITSRVGPSTR
jgi:hypothetical protein